MPLFLAFVFLTFVFWTVLFSLAIFLPFFSIFSESGTASSAPWETEGSFGPSGRRAGKHLPGCRDISISRFDEVSMRNMDNVPGLFPQGE